MLLAMSQEKLGDALGLTFQQVQKYEKGTNRISASRLKQIAGILGVSIDYLYAGGTVADSTAPSGFSEDQSMSYEPDLMTSDGLKLLRAFRGIEDRKVRRRILDLVSALADPTSGATDERSP